MAKRTVKVRVVVQVWPGLDVYFVRDGQGVKTREQARDVFTADGSDWHEQAAVFFFDATLPVPKSALPPVVKPKVTRAAKQEGGGA